MIQQRDEQLELSSPCESRTAARAGMLSQFPAAFIAQLMLPFRPRYAALRAADTTLPVIFFAHVVGMLLGIAVCFIGCTFTLYATDVISPRPSVVERYGSYAEFALSGVRGAWEAMQHPDSWPVITAFALGLEGSLACLAGLLLPWGSADEPLGDSVRRSLRTAWLGAPFAFWWIFGVATAACVLDLILERFFPGIPRYQTPLFLREEFFIGTTMALLGVWMLFALLRAVATVPAPAAHVATTKCESCGYELSHTPIDSRCPECGEPAADSIGEGLRRPSRWEGVRGLHLRAFFGTSVTVLGTPSRFFRTLPAWSGSARARSFLLWNAVLAGLAADASYILFDVVTHPLRRLTLDNILSPSNSLLVFFLPFVAFGCLLGFALLTASWAGLNLSRTQRRNLLAPVAKVFCYASTLYVVWLPATMLLWAGLEGVTTAFNLNLLPERFRYGLTREDQVIFLMLLVNAILPVLMYRYHRLGLRAVTYANR